MRSSMRRCCARCHSSIDGRLPHSLPTHHDAATPAALASDAWGDSPTDGVAADARRRNTLVLGPCSPLKQSAVPVAGACSDRRRRSAGVASAPTGAVFGPRLVHTAVTGTSFTAARRGWCSLLARCMLSAATHPRAAGVMCAAQLCAEQRSPPPLAFLPQATGGATAGGAGAPHVS